MCHRRRPLMRAFFLCLAPACLSAPVSFAAPPAAKKVDSPVTAAVPSDSIVGSIAELRKSDARLEKRVSISEKRVPLSELLETLSIKTGIRLTLADQDKTGVDIPVTVFVRDLPVGDLMDRLWALFTYRGAPWHWEKSAAGSGAPGYQLVRTRAAALFPGSMLAQMQEWLEQDLEEALQNTNSSPEKLTELGKHNKIAASMAKDDRMMKEMSAAASVLTPEQTRSLLRGGPDITLPLAGLPAAVQAYVQNEQKFNTYHGVPIKIRFGQSHSRNNFVPTIMFLIGEPDYESAAPKSDAPKSDAPTGFVLGRARMTDIFSGGALSGGVPQEQEYVDRITDRWILPGDRRETDAEVRVPVVVSSAKGTAVAPDAAAKPAGNRDPAIVASRLAALFQSTGLPIVARLPDLQEDPGAAAGSDKPLSAFLDGLHQKQIRHKWHDGTLLVTHARWMKDEGTPSPYPPGLLRQLEAAVNSDPRGLMPLSGVCLALSQREAGVPLMPPPKEVTAWSDLLVPLAGNTALLTDLQSKQGADIGSLPLRALRRIRAAALRKNVPVTGQSRLRLTTTDEDKLPGFNHRRRILRIELLPDGGTGAAAAAQTLDTFTLVDREEAEPAKPVPPLAG